ncbi:hybrid sensor histidine kinase/response regulator [Ramlibacter albus]|uniref:Chemotaxis protein CheA n=1 Tax=Ramlibacter albus TaxID=2079448 RepID=A0A923S0E5_9BURK|nr:Hpt domain-containing protein [Ramlibacter albus]MBC5763175.1 Hpt domain-containing protein [Ramlibacter albus]
MQANDTDLDLATNDLGPLAWVLDELRKSLESASSALRRFVRDATLARGQDMASVDAGQLRIARQQLHQAVGALEMVGLAPPAHMLRAMESAVQKFVERPELCTEAASSKVERAGFALTEYLEALLLGKPVSAVALFPQYKDVQELAGADRVHPADLWAFDWRWIEPASAGQFETLVYDPAVRSKMDQAVLRIVKSGDSQAARDLADASIALAGSQTAKQPKAFWKIAAGYFEAMAQGLLPGDLYVKRCASRVLLQYASLAKGDMGVSDRLAQDLVFFCSQAVPQAKGRAPLLEAVRAAYGLARTRPVDYGTPQFGRFDPAVLSQARKRIVHAKESWSALSGGEASKLKGVSEHFHQLNESLVKLYPTCAKLAQELNTVVDGVARSGRPPAAELAMEVATAVLYIEAALQDLDTDDAQIADRTERLATRLSTVIAGNPPGPLEHWMEELYRRVSDRQTMGSVVGELRGTLAELEKLLDQFFRAPNDKAPLQAAPQHLLQMRGVLSVLGLDQAAQAVGRMRDTLDEILVTEIDEEKARAAGTFDKLGNNLGALGFLIDMLNYQPALAKKLFVYDDSTGELRPLMGRAQDEPEAQDAQDSRLSDDVMDVVQEAQESGFGEMLTAKLDSIATKAVLAEEKGVAQAAREVAAKAAQDPALATVALSNLAAAVAPVAPVATPAPAPVAAPAEAEVDAELLEIFLEEAREVVGNGLAAIQALATAPSDVSELTTLRRAFHTLKGSSRMVGLNEFGEAGWSMEQVLNTWLADQKPATDDLRTLCTHALQGFGRWVDDIANHSAGAWKAGMFRGPADALRTEHKLVELKLPAAGGAEPQAPAQPVVEEVVALEPAPVAIEPVAVEPAAAIEPLVFEPVPEVAVPVAEPAPIEPAAIEISFEAPVEAPAPVAPPAAEPPAFDLGTISLDVTTEAPPAATPAPAIEVAEAFDLPDDMFAPPEAAAPAAPTEPVAEAPLSLDIPAGPVSFDTTQVIRGEPAAAAEIPHDELPPEFEMDLGATLRVDDSPATPAAPIAELPAEIAGIDFGSLSAVSGANLAEPMPEPQPEVPPEVLPEMLPEALAEPEAVRDEQVKVIGSLRIGIPLYNVYLNEADEWSRRLSTEVSEWALQITERVPDSTVGWAHALAGSSATVGFTALSDVARALENSLEHAQSLAYGTPQHAQAFSQAAEEIRRLLHQFAAGFLKEPDARVVEALQALRDLDIPERVDAADSVAPEFGEMDFSNVEVVEAPVVAELPEVPEVPPVPQAAPVAATQPEPVMPRQPEPVPVAPAAPEQPVLPAQAAGAGDHLEGDEDIDVADAIDPDLFPIFEEEAVELMPSLGGALRQWASRPDNRGARDEALRVLHTLKGSARLAGALRLGEMAHRLESEVEYLGTESVNPADIEQLLGRFDNLTARFEALRTVGSTPEVVQSPTPVIVSAPIHEPLPEAKAEEPQAQAEQPLKAAPLKPLAPAARAIAMPAATTVTAARQSANQAVRVRAQLLDRLVNQAGEVMITRSRLENELKQLRASLGDLTGNLDRLRGQLREIEVQAESQMQSRIAQQKEVGGGFDPLEFDRFTRTQELTRFMAESVNDIATVQRNIQRVVEATEDDLIAQARQTRELQRDLLRTRMVEFEGISDRLYRVVRLAAKESGKQVKLDIFGGSIEMDRGVLDRMTPAFEHLLRNCVAHGVEDPAVRVSAGKTAVGNIEVTVLQEGNDVSVTFRDDGAGLNVARIRQKALEQGLVTADQQLTDADAANLIFMPGFSTATQVTELAGRGIGMDVVRSEVAALGGRIETTTQAGQGSSFKLVLPLTTAVTQVVMIRSGRLSVGVPANLVELVRRATVKEVQQAYESGTFEFGGEQLPFFWSGALLQSSARSVEPQGKTLPVVIFRSAAQRAAVHVDEVLGNQEVVVKNLGPQLSRLPGLAGMTVLASGAVVLIYNPVALTQVYGEQARALSVDKAQPEVMENTAAAEAAKAVVAAAAEGLASPPIPQLVQQPPQIPLVLVVDDSITVRRVTQRLLQREGYRVALAADGLQALEKLAEERPAVVLSDIEMPRMDGFDLARNIRNDARLKDLPIVMITSRIAEKHKEHARELGVNHYLGKPYSEEELLSLVKHYCASLTAA